MLHDLDYTPFYELTHLSTWDAQVIFQSIENNFINIPQGSFTDCLTQSHVVFEFSITSVCTTGERLVGVGSQSNER